MLDNVSVRNNLTSSSGISKNSIRESHNNSFILCVVLCHNVTQQIMHIAIPYTYLEAEENIH